MRWLKEFYFSRKFVLYNSVHAIFIFIKEKCGMRSETFFFLSLFSAPCHYPCLVTVFFYGEKAVIAVLNSLAKLASPFFHDACRYTYHKLANFLCDHRFSRVSQKVRLRLCFICLFLTIIASRNSFAKFTSYFCRVTFNHSFSPSQKGLFHIQPSCTRLCCIFFIFLFF